MKLIKEEKNNYKDIKNIMSMQINFIDNLKKSKKKGIKIKKII